MKAIFLPVTHSSASQQDLKLSKSSKAVAHTVDSDISYAVVPNHTLKPFFLIVLSSRGKSVFAHINCVNDDDASMAIKT